MTHREDTRYGSLLAQGRPSEAAPPELICIPPDRVAQIWPHVSHFIAAAMRRGRISDFADVERAVLSGTQLLWLATDAATIYAAAVTSLDIVAGAKLCTIVACGGRALPRFLPLIAGLEAFARAEGCRAIRIFGRRGWARALRDYNTTSILLEKPL